MGRSRSHLFYLCSTELGEWMRLAILQLVSEDVGDGLSRDGFAPEDRGRFLYECHGWVRRTSQRCSVLLLLYSTTLTAAVACMLKFCHIIS